MSCRCLHIIDQKDCSCPKPIWQRPHLCHSRSCKLALWERWMRRRGRRRGVGFQPGNSTPAPGSYSPATQPNSTLISHIKRIYGYQFCCVWVLINRCSLLPKQRNNQCKTQKKGVEQIPESRSRSTTSKRGHLGSLAD